MGEKERIDLDRTFQISGSLSKGDGQWRPATFRDRFLAFFGQSKQLDATFQTDAVPCTIVGHWIGCAFWLFQIPDADAILSPLRNQVDVSSQYGTITIAQDTPIGAFEADWPTPIDLVPTDEISWFPDGGPTAAARAATTYILRRL